MCLALALAGPFCAAQSSSIDLVKTILDQGRRRGDRLDAASEIYEKGYAPEAEPLLLAAIEAEKWDPVRVTCLNALAVSLSPAARDAGRKNLQWARGPETVWASIRCMCVSPLSASDYAEIDRVLAAAPSAWERQQGVAAFMMDSRSFGLDMVRGYLQWTADHPSHGGPFVFALHRFRDDGIPDFLRNLVEQDQQIDPTFTLQACALRALAAHDGNSAEALAHGVLRRFRVGELKRESPLVPVAARLLCWAGDKEAAVLVAELAGESELAWFGCRQLIRVLRAVVIDEPIMGYESHAATLARARRYLRDIVDLRVECAADDLAMRTMAWSVSDATHNLRPSVFEWLSSYSEFAMDFLAALKERPADITVWADCSQEPWRVVLTSRAALHELCQKRLEECRKK